MNPHLALMTAGVIFAFIGLMHLLRLIYKAEITISGNHIGLWVSVLGFIIPVCLSIWMFLASAA